MRLNPGLSVVPVGPEVMQIGSGIRSLQLDGCTEPVRRLLSRLSEGIPDGRECADAADCGLEPGQARALLQELSPVLVPTPQRPAAGGHLADLLAEDLRSASAVGAQERTPNEVLTRRRAAAVQLLGLGRTGAVAARVLVSAGIGQLTVWDHRAVTTSDLGTGHVPADLGRNRAVALARRLETDVPDTLDTRHTVVWPLAAPSAPPLAGDLSLVIGRGALDLDVVAQARAADQPLLPVVVRDDDVLIGPWMDPSVAGCPLCWELTAAEMDELRPLRTGALHEHEAGWEQTALATAAGALAAGQMLHRVDTGRVPGGGPELPDGGGTVTRISAAGAVAQTLSVAPHPLCGCALGAVPAAG